MSTKKNPIVSCASKQRHVSEEAAHAFLKSIGSEMYDEVYPCPHCNGYHIATIKGLEKIKQRRISEKTSLKKTVGKFKYRQRPGR